MTDSLLDIAPVTEHVPVASKRIEVSGISMKDIGNLLNRFPKLLEVFSRKKSMTVNDLIVFVPEAIGAIIAAGAGHINDKKVEMAIENLPIGDQVSLLSAIVKLTLPGGFGPLVEQIEGFAAMAGKVPQTVSIQNEQLKGNSQDQLST